ncbi:MAG: hypothetical protein ACREOD_02580 [Candidatus Dormibacteria bacterium]
MSQSPPEPVLGEIVTTSVRAPARARLAALLLASAPLALRLGFWWAQSRGRTTRRAAAYAAPVAVERTEVTMVKRTLGRWRVHAVSTRWLLPSGTMPASLAVARPPRRGWLEALLRLATLALEGRGAREGSETPRRRLPPGPVDKVA